MTVRTLHVIDSLGAGGAEKSLVDLLARVPADIDPRVVCLHRRAEGFGQAARDAGIDVRHVPATSRAGRVRWLRTMLRDWRPALVHTTLFEADLVGRLAAALGGPPVLTSLVNTSYGPHRLLDERVSRRRLQAVQAIDGVTARRLTDHFHAITEAVRQAAVADLGVSPSRITVVPRGRDPDQLGQPSAERRATVRERLGIAGEVPVVCNIGRREPQKGQDTLLAAAAAMRPRHPDALWLVAGRDGNASAALAATADRLGLDGTVRFLGHRDDVADLLVAADVFALPSRYEGLGGSLLEAMALGVPSVASDVPALREVLADGAAGRLVPPGDGTALADEVAALLDDPARRQALGRAGREHFLRHYTIERSTDAMVALLRRVAAGSGARA